MYLCKAKFIATFADVATVKTWANAADEHIVHVGQWIDDYSDTDSNVIEVDDDDADLHLDAARVRLLDADRGCWIVRDGTLHYYKGQLYVQIDW